MSKHAPPNAVLGEPLTLESGLDALQSSSEFGGPVESLDGHDCNDHFAQIYETREEKFAAAIPFVRHGLERGERIAYVVDQSTEADVKAAMRDNGIDVEAAIASGALVFYTVQDTYLRDGTFVPDEMIQFYADATATANEEYEALRLVAEMSWIEADDTPYEQVIEYESKINDLFDDENVIAICQYDRGLFAPQVIRDIVRTHPHLIYDGAACHNFYYTPPEELLGADQPAREADRMLETLRERTEAKTTLQHREQFLQDLYEITASTDRSFEAKLEQLLTLGCEWFDFDFASVNRVDPAADLLEIEYVSGEHEEFEPGAEYSLSQTYSQAAVEMKAATSVPNPAEEGLDDLPIFDDFGIHGYMGTYIPIDGGTDRTLSFIPDRSRSVTVTAEDRTYLELLGRWLGYELNRHQREQFLRECYELTSDPDLGFETKLERLLTIGRDRLGLDAAGLTYLPSWDGEFLTEYAVGYGDESGETWTNPSEGCFCRRAIAEDEPVGMADVRGTGWEDDPIHQEHGLTSYLGTRVTSGSRPYGTVWVGSTEPREREFSETERTFLELIGQWVSYELERREHNESQRLLYDITSDPDLDTESKLDRLLELGCDHLDLPIGLLVSERGNALEIQQLRGTHPDLAAGTTPPTATAQYCHRVIETGDPASVTDIGAVEGLTDTDDAALETYVGVPVVVGGQPCGTLCFGDVSARRTAFTEAEHAFLDLMGQCVSYELGQQRRERGLEESNERLEQFAYAASHDLQEPLRMVTSYLQLLETRYGDAFDEDGEDFLAFAVDGAERMRTMIDALLEYSRVETRGDPFEPVALDGVLDAVLEDLQIQIEETDAEITSHQLPRIEGDADQLRQVLQNLLSNAITYSGDEPPRIAIDAERRGQEWVISVHDDGIGIEPADQDRIFTIFNRLHSREEYDGTGIGLALCQRIVERHGGEIRVESEPGEGSTFSFTLPEF